MYRYAPNEFRFFSGRRAHGELVVVLVPNLYLPTRTETQKVAVVNVQNPVVHRRAYRRGAGVGLRGQRARDPYPPHRAAALVEPRPRVWQRSGKDPGATAVDSRRRNDPPGHRGAEHAVTASAVICPRYGRDRARAQKHGADRCRTSRRRTCCRRDPGGRACVEPARNARPLRNMPAGLCFESTKATVLAFHAARDAAHHFVDLSHRVEVARKGNFAIV